MLVLGSPSRIRARCWFRVLRVGLEIDGLGDEFPNG